MKKLLVLFAALGLSACSSGVLPVGPNTYTVEVSGYGSPTANRKRNIAAFWGKARLASMCEMA
jgi:hypothetical protein